MNFTDYGNTFVLLCKYSLNTFVLWRTYARNSHVLIRKCTSYMSTKHSVMCLFLLFYVAILTKYARFIVQLRLKFVRFV